MLFSSCKRALQYGCFQCRRGRAVSAIIGLSKNYGCQENDGIWAFGRCTTRLSAVSAGCHAMIFEDGGTHARGPSRVVDNDKGAPNERACPITREDGDQGSTEEKYLQAQVLRSHYDTHIVGLQEMRLKKTPVVSCDKALCPAETCASCPHGQQGKGDDGESTFECDRTFCPPERGEHCPLAQQGLPQPRGDQSLAHQLDDGLHNLNRTLKQPRAYHALFVDAAGTLIHASQSTEEIYHQIGVKYGVHYSEDEIAAKYKAAYGQPWCRYRMRYEDDGRLFWQCIVQEATGCKDPGLLEDLYHYYTTEKAWHIGDPDAEKSLKAIRRAGIKIAVVSNFDTRLRPLMRVLECYDWFDTIVVSAEVGVEKPNPEIFMIACKELGVKPEQVLHVGDDKTNDIVGASAAGCDSLLWGLDVASFAEVAKKLGVKV